MDCALLRAANSSASVRKYTYHFPWIYWAIVAFMPLCVSVYSCHKLSSQCCVHKINHQPHKSKELTEVFFFFFFSFPPFFIRLKDYIIWFSVCWIHIHANLVADGRRRRTCTHHTLTVSFVLTQTRFDSFCRQTVHTQQRTCTRTHSQGDTTTTTPPLVGKPDPRCPEAERLKDGERDQWTQWCVRYLHPSSQSSLSLSPSSSSFHPHPPNSKLQIQQSASSAHSLVKSHTNILSILICLIPHLTQTVHAWQSPAKSRAQACFPPSLSFSFFFFLPWISMKPRHLQWHLTFLLPELYIHMSCRITCWLKKMSGQKNASSHKDKAPECQNLISYRSASSPWLPF